MGTAESLSLPVRAEAEGVALLMDMRVVVPVTPTTVQGACDCHQCVRLQRIVQAIRREEAA